MCPKHKRLNKQGRLQAAKHWLPKYNGKNVVRGYRKHFGVTMICAALELQMLGYEISPTYLEQLKADEIRRQMLAEQRRSMKVAQKQLEEYIDSNETFYYIAGYTSNGVPYGITLGRS